MIIQYILAIICASALIGAWTLFRKGKISVFAAWFWSGLWTLGLVVSLFPNLASVVATAVGVGRGVDVVVYLAIILTFYLIFRVFIRLDRIERDITSMVRQVAIKQAEKEYGDRKNSTR